MNAVRRKILGRCGSLVALVSIVFGADLFSTNAFAAPSIYVVRGRGGVVTFTSRQPRGGQTFALFKPERAAFSVYSYRSSWRGVWRPRPVKSTFDGLIKQTAETHSLDPTLLKAVVHVESAFNSNARSYKGAMGLMQLMPGTARRFGVRNPYQADQNVSGGSRYLRWLLDRYSGNEKLAIAAYNAGEGAVDDYGTIPPYSETQTYVKRVLKMRELYRCVESGSKSC